MHICLDNFKKLRRPLFSSILFLLVIILFLLVSSIKSVASSENDLSQPTPTPSLYPPDNYSELQSIPVSSVSEISTQQVQISSNSLQLLETLTVPVNGSSVQTSFNLAQGVEYTVRVSGVYQWGLCSAYFCPGGAPDYIRWGDAEYLTDDNWQHFSSPFWSGFVYFEVNGGNPNFGPYNPEHNYSIQITGDGQQANFRFHDCNNCYGDNAGSLTVEILKATDCILPSGLDICQLQKGDILIQDAAGTGHEGFAGFVGTYWFHTGFYDGEGNILEAAGTDLGVRSQPIHSSSFADIDVNDLVVLRVNPEHQPKVDGAIEWARRKIQEGVVFMPSNEFLNLNNKEQDAKFYCSLFVWRAYKKQGLDLDFDTGFYPYGSILANKLLQQVLPDDLYASSLLGSKPTMVVQDKNPGFLRTLKVLLSPADLRVIDSSGNITGIDLQTGSVINNIPGAFYSGPGEEPEWITIPNNIGASTVEVYGTDTGLYSFGTQVFVNQSVDNQIFQWETRSGQVDIFEVPDPSSGSVQIHPVLLTAQIDIKPGRFPNRIQLTSNVCNDDDNVYVAVLTTSTFNANTVDISTLQFGDPQLSGKIVPYKIRLNDVDLDGDKDLALTFSLCSIVSSGAININSTEMALTGKLLDGVSFTGSDSIKVVQ